MTLSVSCLALAIDNCILLVYSARSGGSESRASC
jgi:hypothetical protein